MITQHKDMIEFESDSLRVVLDPACGGKIRSLVSRRTQTEFLFQDHRSCFDGSKGFSYHDLSGMNECFPTVGKCQWTRGKFAGMSLGDHGLLWQQHWNTKIEDDTVVQWLDDQQFQFRFTRMCSFANAHKLRCDYSIHNFGVDDLEYIYSAHPLFFADEHTRLEFAASARELYIATALGQLGLRENQWENIPFSTHANQFGPFNPAKETLLKAFTRAGQSPWVKLHRLDKGESLKIEADQSQLPYMGILISQGFDCLGDGDFRRKLFAGIEPTSGIGDDLKVCASTGTTKQLAPSQIANFWITIELHHNNTGIVNE